MTLEGFIVGEIFVVLLIFARIGSAIMFMPGVGEMYVPTRVRLLFALSVSYLLAQIMKESFPEPPGSVLVLFVLIATEATIGVFMGLLTKILLSVMHTAGMVIASQSSLATAMLFDATQGGQSASVGIFLSITAILVIISMDLHQLMLAAFIDSYSLMEVGIAPPLSDMANYMGQIIIKCFDLAIRFAMPIVAAALTLNVGAGILNRLMPSMHVFFVLIPIQLLMAFFLLAAVLSAIMLWYSEFVRETMQGFLSPI